MQKDGLGWVGKEISHVLRLPNGHGMYTLSPQALNPKPNDPRVEIQRSRSKHQSEELPFTHKCGTQQKHALARTHASIRA